MEKEYSRAERAILWLCAGSGYDERTRAALLRAAGDPARLLSDFEKISASVIQDGQKRVYKGDRATRERETDALCAELSEKGYFAVTAASVRMLPTSFRGVNFSRCTRAVTKRSSSCMG